MKSKDLADLYCDTLRSLLPEGPVKGILLDYPCHKNVGDLAIWQGELILFERMGIPLVADLSFLYPLAHEENLVRKADIIFFHGGGNFGDLYRSHQIYRLNALRKYCDRKIVMLPQSVHYNNIKLLKEDALEIKKHPDCHIFTRDKESCELLQEFGLKSSMCPDSAHALTGFYNSVEEDRGMLSIYRKDKERSESNRETSQKSVDWGKFVRDSVSAVTTRACKNPILRSIPFIDRLVHDVTKLSLKRYLHMNLKEIARYSEVETDRLHGMILGYTLGKKVIYSENSYGKLGRYADCWMKGEPNVIAKN